MMRTRNGLGLLLLYALTMAACAPAPGSTSERRTGNPGATAAFVRGVALAQAY
jgi:hypothetical protein